MRSLMSFSLPAPSMIVVLSLSILTDLALPSCVMSVFSSLRPRSSVITSPPVRIAISSSIALRLSPKPGALTAQVLSVPRMLFTINVASASPSMSSAIMRSCLPVWATFSSNGSKSFMLEIFLSWMRIRQSLKTVSILSRSVTKYGEM